MSNENMDRLFGERAEQYESKPSAAAWDSIQSQIGTKPTGLMVVWKVAAVLIVLISSVLVVFNWENSSTETLSGAIDHPQLTEKLLVWDLPTASESNDAIASVAAVETVTMPTAAPQEHKEILIADDASRPYLELQRIAVSWEIEAPSKPALFNNRVSETSVKIRYYASTSEPEKTKKSFGQFIARAQQKLSPDVLLADIRTAKDDLFRSNRGD